MAGAVCGMGRLRRLHPDKRIWQIAPDFYSLPEISMPRHVAVHRIRVTFARWGRVAGNAGSSICVMEES